MSESHGDHEHPGRWGRHPPAPTRRAGESGDFTRVRNGRHGVDRLTKVVVLAVFAGAISVLGFLLAADRGGIKASAEAGDSRSLENRAQLGLVALEQQHIIEDVSELKAGQKAIVAGQQTIIDTLYKLPSQRRASERPVLEAPD